MSLMLTVSVPESKAFSRIANDYSITTNHGGAFSTGTVITKIIYHAAAAYGNRARGSWFEASVDGVRWFRIAALPSNMAAGATVELEVACLSQFRYIRMVQPSGYYIYNWTLGVAEVYGVPAN